MNSHEASTGFNSARKLSQEPVDIDTKTQSQQAEKRNDEGGCNKCSKMHLEACRWSSERTFVRVMCSCVSKGDRETNRKELKSEKNKNGQKVDAGAVHG